MCAYSRRSERRSYADFADLDELDAAAEINRPQGAGRTKISEPSPWWMVSGR
jgi:hypothetical protein